ncbi:EB1 protein [Histomonas meleagridis]|uniref:EB1 protein n=1 Tax=Histomonas meleagridis TaxID=135588 RepID=UPI00355AAD58|nr:EB1 protein [Histomonas meleagridis]KAH0802340.1 EB1 protein [Histomonas meleagridis]
MAKPMGMMSGCYFVGRAELLDWINNLLCLKYDKVEDTSNGAAFCQVIDCIHPGTVALGRVNYNARTEPEMVENYKILQDAFDKNGIKQYIDVNTLTKGKYMAALELFQWIHGYFEQTGPHEEYDAVGRRKQTRCKEPNERDKMPGKPAGMASNRTRVAPGNPPIRSHPTPSVPPAQGKPLRRVGNTTKASAPRKVAKEPVAKHQSNVQATNAHASDSSAKEVKALKTKVNELTEEVEQMSQERDFYYDKLRKVEDYCQDHENEPNIKEILDILYEADESKGFLPPEEEDYE